MKSTLVAAVMIAIGSTVADAQSLKEKLYFADTEQALATAKLTQRANQKCEVQLAAKIDWTAVPPEFAGKDLPPLPDGKLRDRGHASSYCLNVFSALEDVCATEPGKTVVRQKVRSIVCGFGPERTIELKDGVLTFKMNVNTYNNDDFIREYLLNNL
jgi:hypothetical protein